MSKRRAGRKKARKEPERTCYINRPEKPLRHHHPLCGGTWRMSGEVGHDMICDNCGAHATSTVANLEAAWEANRRRA